MIRSLVTSTLLFGASLLASPSASAQCFTAYDNAGFSGSSTQFCGGGEALRNDSYSSLRVPAGMRVRGFEHGNRTGIARTYFADSSYVGGAYNDVFSAFTWGQFSSDGFYMLVASDPQLSWDHCSDNSGSAECAFERQFFAGKSEDEIGRTYNGNLVRALNQVGAQVGEGALGGAIVNGDLTEFGDQGPDLGDYVSLYERGLGMNVYLGLGNHDYDNNVDDCSNNQCASAMIGYAAQQIQTLNPVSFDYAETGVYYQFPSSRKRYEGSLSYSWEIGNVHFVQLHNYPSYTRSWNGWNFGAARRDHYEIRSSLAWLRSDLERAMAAGKRIVLNLHDWGAARDSADFEAIVTQFPVSAIFAGHWHGTYGELEQWRLANGRSVPVLLSGSAHVGTFLVTRYLAGKLYVWVFRVDHYRGAKLQVRIGGTFRDVTDLASVLCTGCSRSYENAYDLR